MRKLVFLIALLAIPSTAHAQIAAAIGQPLPEQDLPVGTVKVRLIEGAPDKPVAGVEVRLTVNGDVRTAVTDATGKAQFPGLTPGAKIQAEADGKATPDGKSTPVQSVEFPLPEDSGVAVMLSTVPFTGMGGGPGGGRPDPKVMTGQPREEGSDPAGRVTVRISYDDWDGKDDLADKPVVLLAYAADGRVAAKSVHTDADGRAEFDDLDTSGATAYYAMTMLPRDGASDRLESLPIVPGSDVGMRVMLSGEKLKSGAPADDDLTKYAQEPKLPPGKVIVIFGGESPPEEGTAVLHAADGSVIAKADVTRGQPIESTITATVQDAKDSDKPGNIQLSVLVDADGQKLGLPQAPVHISGAGFDHQVDTDKDGNVSMDGAPSGVPLTATVTVEGKTFTGKPFTIAAGKGASIECDSSFELLSISEADFDGVAATPESGDYAEIDVKGKTYRSPPFQMAPERGAVVPIFVIEPQLQFTFELDSWVEDDYLAVQGDFALKNASFIPYTGPSEGIRVPVPHGSTGLGVADESKSFVAVDAGAFRMLRPVPPMGGDFRAGFSVPLDEGSVSWDMPMPMGSQDGSLAIRQLPSMKFDVPSGKGKSVKDPQSGYLWYAINGITIPPDQRMVFDISGLPERPAWQHWARLLTGLAVILLLALGLGFAFAQREASRLAAAGPTPKKQRRRRIEDLLDQVTELDRAVARGGGDANKRERLVVELESLYAEDDA